MPQDMRGHILGDLCPVGNLLDDVLHLALLYKPFLIDSKVMLIGTELGDPS